MAHIIHSTIIQHYRDSKITQSVKIFPKTEKVSVSFRTVPNLKKKLIRET